MKLGQKVCLSKISNVIENESCRSKTTCRSVGQILEKKNEFCVCSRGHIFHLIHLKFSQNVGFDDFLDKTEKGSYRIKN